jgi:hypothetical protein
MMMSSCLIEKVHSQHILYIPLVDWTRGKNGAVINLGKFCNEVKELVKEMEKGGMEYGTRIKVTEALTVPSYFSLY